MRAFAVLCCAVCLTGLAPALDSQAVVARYERAVIALREPSSSIFSYTVSQAGAGNIESRHRMYRSGANVRDETIAENGQTIHPKRVTIERRENRYAVTRLAPRTPAYRFLFVSSVRDGGHLDYIFDTEPIAAASNFAATRVTIDGLRFLPRSIAFTTAGAAGKGSGTIQFAPSGPYWVPSSASISATVNASPARERIAFSDYRFPDSLPASTFATPRPLPQASLPAF